MNALERKMVDVLLDLKENHHVSGVKAEFEAEGTRLEEAMRLKEVISAAGLGLTLKIGGCEAIRDMYEARVLGVARVVAPMVESPYALSKYLDAVSLCFPEDERSEVAFAVNIETAAGSACFDEMLALPEIAKLDGVVVGRIDLSRSLGLTRMEANSAEVFEYAHAVLGKAHEQGLECAIGGGIGAEALPFLRELADRLDRYETRKVIFECPGALDDNADKGMLKAVGFELMWLKNKRDFYGAISAEDEVRIDMLQSRYDNLILAAGGVYE